MEKLLEWKSIFILFLVVVHVFNELYKNEILIENLKFERMLNWKILEIPKNLKKK